MTRIDLAQANQWNPLPQGEGFYVGAKQGCPRVRCPAIDAAGASAKLAAKENLETPDAF